MIDVGNWMYILFLDSFEKMGTSKKDLKGFEFPLIGFIGRIMYPLGSITLPVVLVEGWKIIQVSVTFIVVDASLCTTPSWGDHNKP